MIRFQTYFENRVEELISNSSDQIFLYFVVSVLNKYNI